MAVRMEKMRQAYRDNQERDRKFKEEMREIAEPKGMTADEYIDHLNKMQQKEVDELFERIERDNERHRKMGIIK